MRQGDSLIKDLRLMKRGQKLRFSTALLAVGGRTRVTSSEHFGQVCNVSSDSGLLSQGIASKTRGWCSFSRSLSILEVLSLETVS